MNGIVGTTYHIVGPQHHYTLINYAYTHTHTHMYVHTWVGIPWNSAAILRQRGCVSPKVCVWLCAHAPVETLVSSSKQPSQSRFYFVDINIVITISDTAPEVNFVWEKVGFYARGEQSAANCFSCRKHMHMPPVAKQAPTSMPTICYGYCGDTGVCAGAIRGCGGGSGGGDDGVSDVLLYTLWERCDFRASDIFIYS